MEEEDVETKTNSDPLHLEERTCVRLGPTDAASCLSSPSGSVRAKSSQGRSIDTA